MIPVIPSLPLGYIYTPYYCEENIYLLAAAFTQDRCISDRWETFVIFLSNPTRTVAIWSQKLSKDSNYPVIWDYHCILLLKPRSEEPSNLLSWVFDYDTRLTTPCPALEYIKATLGSSSFQSQLDDKFQSFFRVISAADYLHFFASDRSHMLVIHDDGSQIYSQSPPSYPCIVGKQIAETSITNNLMESFVSMTWVASESSPEADGIGQVMNFKEFLDWIEK